jgi:hypothetical protein
METTPPEEPMHPDEIALYKRMQNMKSGKTSTPSWQESRQGEYLE